MQGREGASGRRRACQSRFFFSNWAQWLRTHFLARSVVEVAVSDEAVGVRDSKDLDGGFFVVSPAQ
ncbi:DUF397 domain-containing protein [Saccharopolyspora sp. ASAGF58]|uniref:DUF397 domain-containing protein n=1 Tax=Saccharopolyspora sp. ASAGF58 TaxID=2719023 RepID=UPI001440239D|nr:DUF397 domain-containing protein [Saccharopolyspora sp. ASAGF58]QIZ40056.1 DUF397 domain-containing protein [Saccharopolyspora sp. ASAGF58]